MQYIFYLDDSGTKEFVLGDKEYTRQGPPSVGVRSTVRFVDAVHLLDTQIAKLCFLKQHPKSLSIKIAYSKI